MLARCAAVAVLLALPVGCGGGTSPAMDDPAPAPGTTAPDSVAATPTDAPTPSTGSATPDPPAPPSQSTPAGTEILVSGSEFGPMLFDSTGQAIYLFDVETTSEPECYDECAEAWPPVLTTGAPVAGRGVDGSLLSTTRRSDGSVQVTYNDHPLYFYAHEGKHEVECHDVFLNGGIWYVVRPDGDAAPPG